MLTAILALALSATLAYLVVSIRLTCVRLGREAAASKPVWFGDRSI